MLLLQKARVININKNIHTYIDDLTWRVLHKFCRNPTSVLLAILYMRYKMNWKWPCWSDITIAWHFCKTWCHPPEPYKGHSHLLCYIAPIWCHIDIAIRHQEVANWICWLTGPVNLNTYKILNISFGCQRHPRGIEDEEYSMVKDAFVSYKTMPPSGHKM